MIPHCTPRRVPWAPAQSQSPICWACIQYQFVTIAKASNELRLYSSNNICNQPELFNLDLCSQVGTPQLDKGGHGVCVWSTSDVVVQVLHSDKLVDCNVSCVTCPVALESLVIVTAMPGFNHGLKANNTTQRHTCFSKLVSAWQQGLYRCAALSHF